MVTKNKEENIIIDDNIIINQKRLFKSNTIF